MNDSLSTESADGLKSVVKVLARDARLIAITAFGFALIAGVGAFISEKQYKASVLFSVVSNDQRGGAASGMLPQLGTLASLAGVSLGGQSEKYEAIALLQSRLLTEMFIRQNELLPVLFPRDWDAKTAQWKARDAKLIPTVWKGEIEFRKIRSVVQDPKTSLVTLSITWRDPVLAAKWANALVALTNQETREKAIKDSDRNIAYLREQAEKTPLISVQTALSALMEGQYKQSMLAGGNDEYVLKVIDPADVPELPSSLRRAYVVLGGFLGGLFVGSLFVIVRSSWRVEQQPMKVKREP